MESENEEMVINEEELGAQNWDEIWSNWYRFGTDWMTKFPQNKPLNPYELQFLNNGIEEKKELRQLVDIEWKEELGKGAFATVWLVEAKRYYGYDWEDLELACKVIRMKNWHVNHTESYIEAVEQFRTEMVILRYIKHENIVKIVDIITIPESRTNFPFATICLFMELIDGNLQTLIKSYRTGPNNTATELDARCPEDLSRYWFKQIAGAVKYLHDQNIVHNDIKADNIFYSLPTYILGFTGETASQQSLRRSVFKLGDFGRAGEHNEHKAIGPDIESQVFKTKPNDIIKLGKALLHSSCGLNACLKLMESYWTQGMYENIIEIIKPFDLSNSMTDLIVKMIKLNQEERVSIDEVLDHHWVIVEEEIEVVEETEFNEEEKWENPDDWGEDWKTEIPNKKPLLRNQMQFLRKGNQLRKARNELMDIKWHNVLGESAFGTVWKVRAKQYYGNNKFEDLALACKVLRIDLTFLFTFTRSTLRAAAQYLLNDIQIVRGLIHEHIIQFVDVIKIADRKTGFPFAVVCLFMELCNGTLMKFANLSPSDPNYEQTPEHLSKYWFKQILQALKYLHNRNIAHNDIKMDNIFYSYPRYITYFTGKSASKQSLFESTFKLGDFGTAAIDDSPQRLSMLNDIEKLGNTLLESSIGCVSYLLNIHYMFPSDGITPEELSEEPFGFSEGMAHLISAMTTPDPQNRITLDEVLNHRWVTGIYL